MNPHQITIIDQYFHSSWAVWSSAFILLGFALYSYDRYAKRWSACTGLYQTVGIIVFSEVCKSGHGQSQALVTYLYEIDGNIYKGTLPAPKVSLCQFVEKHPVGNHVPVYYAYKDPAYSTAYEPPSIQKLIKTTLPGCFMLPVFVMHVASLAVYASQV